MRKLFRMLVLIVLLSGIFACDKTEKYPKTVEFFEIDRGDLTGRKQGFGNEYLHITDSMTWKAFLNKFDSLYEASSQFTEKHIDFNKFDIIAAIDSGRSHLGFNIKITGIAEFKTAMKLESKNENMAEL